MPDRAATLAELTAVRHALEDINHKLEAQVEAKVAEKTVPREEFDRRVRRSGQRVVGALLVIALMLGGAVLWNRATLRQAQTQSERDIRTVLTTCRASRELTAAQLAFCDRRVPGFSEAREATRRTAETAQRNEARLETLERKIDALQRR